MSREEFRNPIHELQKKEAEKLEIGKDILKNARNELYVSMRFLDVALSALRLVPMPQTGTFGTDGENLYFEPDWILQVFMNRKVLVNRLYLHQLLHCLFGHVWNGKNRDRRLWNLAADITVESIIDDLYQRAVYIRPSAFRRESYRDLHEKRKVFTAEGLYHLFETADEEYIQNLEREFRFDNHSQWSYEDQKKGIPNNQKQWDDIRKKMQTEMEIFSKEASSESKSLLDQLQVENRERYDYKKFLRKFSVLKEEMQVDMDTFDYIFYHYGMEQYGNMPLIEPLETKEVKKIEEFVIVIDTSMSCKGELVKKFLEETYSILSESESFFRKIHLHVIQCDDRIQEDLVIHNNEEMLFYLENFTVKGLGGTDFRPAFEYVESLRRAGKFTKLRGLLYFTDGYGLFPIKMPPYDTAFIFMKEDYRDVDVPPWAMKLIIDTETLEEKEITYEY